MYTNQPPPQNMRKPRYYRDVQGRVYRSMFVGYHYDTDEQCIILREVTTGRIAIVPKQQLYDVVMKDNQYMQKFTELQNFYDPYHSDPRATTHMEYPGFIDDPRTFNRPIRRPYK